VASGIRNVEVMPDRVLQSRERPIVKECRLQRGEIRLELLGIRRWIWELDEQLLAVDESLTRLQALDERAAKVIELRFFGGLSEADAAEALNISTATLKRDWEFARTWLASQLAD
jgi:DNA-directed RNA polymerase specialized sigma24 family protein